MAALPVLGVEACVERRRVRGLQTQERILRLAHLQRGWRPVCAWRHADAAHRAAGKVATKFGS